MSVDVDLRGVPEVKEMLDHYQGKNMDAALEVAVIAASEVYRELVPKAAPKLVGPKLVSADKSEHRDGQAFYVDITPANNLWNMFEKGRKAGYNIPARAPFYRILSGESSGSDFGPVTAPIVGGPQAPAPFLADVTASGAKAAGDAALAVLMADAGSEP